MSIEEIHTLYGYAKVMFFLVMIPATGFWFIGKNLRRPRIARTWPSVPGVIVRSELVPEADSETGEIRTYSVVRYEYEVNGRKIESRQFSIIRDTPLDLTPAEFVAAYPLGMGLRVYYNPADTADAAIVLTIPPRVKRRLIKMLLFIVGFSLVAILLFTPLGDWAWEAVSRQAKH